MATTFGPDVASVLEAGGSRPAAYFENGTATLRAYAAAIRRTPLLSASEERALCRDLEAARRRLVRARARRAAAGVARLEARAGELRDRLIAANLRLVIAIARRYRHAGLPLEDLIQEGNIGLMKAIDRFDHRRGLRFSTYGTWWIRQRMLAAIAASGRTIRLPSNVLGALRKIEAARVALLNERERPPAASDIAARTGLSPARVEALIDAADRPLPLDQRLGGGVLLQDVLSDGRTPTPEARVMALDERRVLGAAISSLDDRERSVLELRFGLGGGREHTLEEIARRLGFSRQRVRRVEERALTRLRLRTMGATVSNSC